MVGCQAYDDCAPATTATHRERPRCGSTGFENATNGLHDLILLDVMLPGEDRLNVCGRLHDAAEHAMITALDAGADDYVVKPFDLTELSARIRAGSRRTREGAGILRGLS